MLWISIDRTSTVPLIRQIYLQLRDRILKGELPAGCRLPASRELAAELKVSRNVVLEAYDQLTAEGYLEGRTGSGTYVAQGASWQRNPTPFPTASHLTTTPDDLIDFRSGIPALDRFPKKQWGQLAKMICLETSPDSFGYGAPEGCIELRSTLSHYILRTRGVHCHPDQLIITTGAAQAFSLIGRLLLSPGDTLVLEDPTTPEIREIFAVFDVEICSVPVDDRGLQTHALPTHPSPRFILITPSHQFPLGSVLTIQRRIELLQFARSTQCWIVEDDYDSEFRYEGTPVSSLQGLDPDRVIYIGTFSKNLSPALRLGYLVLPVPLIEPCRRIKRLTDLHTSVFDQLTLARFIQTGLLDRHINQMKKLYRQRRNTLKQGLATHFSEQVKILGDSTGLHLVAAFTKTQFTSDVLQRIAQQHVRVYPVSNYTNLQNSYQHEIVLGYANLSVTEIEIGLQRLKQVLI
jgi:GntR family transcriptional regulator / MocR family aminotransferase